MTPPSPQFETSAAPKARQIFQVQDLLSTLKHGLEMNFPALWVEGEISNFIAARSGHWYFTLKDERAQIRCACFRNRNMRLQTPSEGQRVLLRAQPTIYTQRGELQLIVEEVQDTGAGALHQAFEHLKSKLQAEGLFEAENKRPLPEAPRCIGVITSADGAAWHDIHSTLARRFPLTQVKLYASQVQGELASKSLRTQLAKALSDQLCDVLIIGRGGGSLEDLQAFNDEQLARDIAAAALPIVSAVGHEVDFAISDFVSDARAATPTAAAEMLSPDIRVWQQGLDQLSLRLGQRAEHHVQQARRNLKTQQFALAVASPRRRLQERAQCLDDLRARLLHHGQRRFRELRRTQALLKRDLMRVSPSTQIKHYREQLLRLNKQQTQLSTQQLESGQKRLRHAQQRLGDLAPQRVLERGYSITRHRGQIVRRPDVAKGEKLAIQLAEGGITAVVAGKS